MFNLKKRFVLFLLITFILFGLLKESNSQITDSLQNQAADSITTFQWKPKILYDLNKFNPESVHSNLQLINPQAKTPLQYYNPENVMPKNSWEMDYRSTSYYTPRIVSDKIAKIMHRPPPDSFVPLPAVALLAVKMASKYLDIKIKIEIKADDYIIDETLEPVLFSLWEKSPQTVAQLYKRKNIQNKRTMDVLMSDIQVLMDKKLVKIRKMQTEADKYFAAQDLATVKKLIQSALETDSLTDYQKQKLSTLSVKIKTLQNDSE